MPSDAFAEGNGSYYLSQRAQTLRQEFNLATTNSWSNQSVVDPLRGYTTINQEEGEQSFAKRLRIYGRDLYVRPCYFKFSFDFNTRSFNYHYLYLFGVKS